MTLAALARVADVPVVTSKRDLDRAVELAHESPLDRVLRLASAHQQHVAHVAHQQHVASTGQVKSYLRGGKLVSGYQGKAGAAKPGSSQPVAAAALKVGSVFQVNGVAYKVIAVGKYTKPATKKGGVVANTKGKTTTTNTAKKTPATKTGAAKATSVSPQKGLFSGAPATGMTSLQVQQVSTGAKFNVYLPPNTSVPVIA